MATEILSLDLGTSTGWARTASGIDRMQVGVIRLATPGQIAEWGRSRRNRNHDPRVKLLHDFVWSLAMPTIVFEDVLFASSTYQTQLWASLRAAVWIAGEGSTIVGCPTGTLKKFATGKGNATKEHMIAAVVERLPKQFGSEKNKLVNLFNNERLTDDAADAIMLNLWAQENLS